MLTREDRELVTLAVPALGALLAEPLYVLADTAVVGRIGTAELGGLGLATQVIGTIISASIFLAYGTTSKISRLLGAGDERGAAHYATQGLWIGLGIGVVFGSGCWFFAEALMDLLRASPDVSRFGVRYLRVSTFGFPPMLMVLAGVGYLRGLKETKRPLFVAGLTAVGNLVLELVLVFGLGFGVGASALSTVIFQWIGAGIYLRWVLSPARNLGVKARPDLSALRSLGRDGLDLFVRTAALRCVFLAAAVYAASLGEAPLAAHEITFAAFMVIALGLDSLAIAAQAMIGRLIGQRRPEDARRLGRRIAIWGIALGVFTAAILAPFAPSVPALFTNDAEVIRQARPLISWLAIFMPAAGAAFALDGVLIGAGDLRFLAKAMWGATFCFALHMIIVVRLDTEMDWVWTGLAGFMAIRALSLWWRLSTPYWSSSGGSGSA